MEASNMAALREAPEKVLEILNREWDAHRETSAMWEMQEICIAALAATPRNCDRFANELDAQLAFLNEVWLISVDRETMLERDKYENWTDEMRSRYGRWLLAPATEQKRGAK